MATIINPITTVLLSPEEFDSGDYDRFMFKYILEKDGTITYVTTFTGDRFICVPEAKIKGLATDAKSPARPSIIQPLARGQKIPEEFFYQIEQFFLDVMAMSPKGSKMGHGSYEAQIFVIWNPATGYRLLVPKQTVSAASVTYDLQEDLSDGDIVIMDVHSHNTMGAFWSGTDDRDDGKNPWISGVFGELNRETKYLFRFNDGTGNHFDLDYDDVFETEEVPAFQTPKAWLDRVSIQSTSYMRPRGKGSAAGGWGSWYGNWMDDADDLDEKELTEMSQLLASDTLVSEEEDLFYALKGICSDLQKEHGKTLLQELEYTFLNPDYCPNLPQEDLGTLEAMQEEVDAVRDATIVCSVIKEVKDAL